MKLCTILKPWIKEQDILDCTIKDITNDSRAIHPGDLFIAYPGAATDGRTFMDKAAAQGAAAIIYEPENFPSKLSLPNGIPCIAISNLGARLSEIAQFIYGNASHILNMTGVTGTNGKTSIAFQLAQAHSLLGQKAAYIGTIGQGLVDELQSLNNTTPDALCLQKLFNQYKRRGVKQVCMEVSSHALSQNRVEHVEFDQAIFTNLTLDHLDYHATMQAYASAKAKLFACDSLQTAIINKDSQHADFMLSALKSGVKRLSYGLYQACDVKAARWQADMQGTAIEIESPWGQFSLKTRALGQFNIYNSLAIFSSLMASGLYAAEDVLEVMTKLHAAPGRMEIVTNSPCTIVDYAHTPDALENVLKTLKPLTRGALWVVFGCGGDRDKSKRPLMGRIASQYADKLIITSDNPRSENPQTIINDIARGISSNKPVFQLENREEALIYALKHANSDDLILIAGKGHEAYQQIGSVKYDFSDQAIVQQISNEIKDPAI